LDKVGLRVSGHRDPSEIAFDIGSKHSGSGPRKPFRENLQAHGFSGAGRAGDESVPVAKRQDQILVNVAFANQNAASFMCGIVGHDGSSNGRARRGCGAPYVAIMRQCGIIAPANLGLVKRRLILA
jgi:hypothetical protein